MECKDVEAVLEQEGLRPLPQAAHEHLAVCEGCRELWVDLSAIVAAAKRIPAEENPPERVWVSLRTQLQAEGIIRPPEVSVEPSDDSWWQGFAPLLRPRVLAMVGAGVLAVAGGLYYRNHPTKTAEQNTTTAGTAASTPSNSAAKMETVVPAVPATTTTLSAENTAKRPQSSRTRAAAVNKPPQIRESTRDLLPSPSELASFGESAATLNQTERAMPSGGSANNAEVEAALRSNLRTLNEFIKECETRLKEDPRDQLTKEYLNMALQQKAELLNAMMESGRSEH